MQEKFEKEIKKLNKTFLQFNTDVNTIMSNFKERISTLRIKKELREEIRPLNFRKVADHIRTQQIKSERLLHKIETTFRQHFSSISMPIYSTISINEQINILHQYMLTNTPNFALEAEISNLKQLAISLEKGSNLELNEISELYENINEKEAIKEEITLLSIKTRLEKSVNDLSKLLEESDKHLDTLITKIESLTPPRELSSQVPQLEKDVYPTDKNDNSMMELLSTFTGLTIEPLVQVVTSKDNERFAGETTQFPCSESTSYLANDPNNLIHIDSNNSFYERSKRPTNKVLFPEYNPAVNIDESEDFEFFLMDSQTPSPVSNQVNGVDLERFSRQIDSLLHQSNSLENIAAFVTDLLQLEGILSGNEVKTFPANQMKLLDSIQENLCLLKEQFSVKELGDLIAILLSQDSMDLTLMKKPNLQSNYSSGFFYNSSTRVKGVDLERFLQELSAYDQGVPFENPKDFVSELKALSPLFESKEWANTKDENQYRLFERIQSQLIQLSEGLKVTSLGAIIDYFDKLYNHSYSSWLSQ